MHSITYKGKPNPKKKCEVKIEMIFFETGYNRVPKVVEVIGSCKDWDQKSQQLRGRSLENKEKDKALSSYFFNDIKEKFLTDYSL